MAIPSDSSFGADFSKEEFETAIRNVMEMGQPSEMNQRATFRWTSKETYAHGDKAGRPLSLNATRTSVVNHPDLQVLCAVSTVSSMGANEEWTDVAEFKHPRAKIQLFDLEYQKIKTANEVLLGENVYKIKYVEPPAGLFDSTTWTLHLTAEDES